MRPSLLIETMFTVRGVNRAGPARPGPKSAKPIVIKAQPGPARKNYGFIF